MKSLFSVVLLAFTLSIYAKIDNFVPAPPISADLNRGATVNAKGDILGEAVKELTGDEDLWHFANPADKGIEGISALKAYAKFKMPKDTPEVIVAVIDRGVDVRHKDLQGKLWVNKNEVMNNGIDDDKNGYIDDIFGWNFIGNAKGNAVIKDADANIDNGFTYQRGEAQYQVVGDTFELTRELVRMRKKEAQGNLTDDEKAYLMELEENYARNNDGSINYQLDSNTRLIVGDNEADLNERNYGNNDVLVNDTHVFHGTHVAGIIAANRLNDDVTKGIASKVRIMAIRVVPDGDERDKDVANGIRYAADNGAKVINMSFGKAYSQNKGVVDQAVAYAQSKGVILVHAAGNSTKNNDVENNFPNRKSSITGLDFDLWIEVGASTYSRMQLPASFSNFGPKSVDVFAPGLDILSLAPNNHYAPASGTSMASPVVAGMVAAMFNFVPKAKPEVVRAALLSSVRLYPGLEVEHAGITREFATLSKTGGVVDLYKALAKLGAKKVSRFSKPSSWKWGF